MTTRLDKPDTAADVKIREILSRQPLAGFVVTAGAGSGKTTSLVKALAHIIETRGERLKAGTQQVACITYTEVAAKEIHADVGNDPRILVATIHSFLWTLAKPFQRDIGLWVRDRVVSKIAKITEKQVGYSGRTSSATIEQDSSELEKLRDQLAKLDQVSHYTYSTGSDYSRGVLGHADVLKMVPELISDRPLLAKIAARRFPIIFVDESQDTFKTVVDCLKRIYASAEGKVCLGFFGDPMQQIYQTGVGAIEVEPDWTPVEKPENFRSSNRVLSVINAVRAGADGLVQISGRPADNRIEGEVFCFVLPANGDRTANLQRVRKWLDAHSSAGNWTDSSPETGAKILMIVHRMAARRLGFGGLYSAFCDHQSSLGDAFREGSAWPLRAFENVIVPIGNADSAESSTVISLLREYGKVFENISASQVRAALASAKLAIVQLRKILSVAGPGSVGEAVRFAGESGLVELDPRWLAYLEPGGDDQGVVLSPSTVAVLDALMECDVSELNGYFRYIQRESPYSTQHGTKGAEFQRVIVVIDDDEGKDFNLYSYGKLLGIKGLSAKDRQNQASGGDSVVERTRRLLYVCVSRAVESLAIVLFVDDVEAAASVLRSGIMADGQPIRTIEDLDEPQLAL